MCKICENGTICISTAKYKNQNARVRLDLDFNQIDCQVIDDDGFGAWSEGHCLDINFCPVCGKKLASDSEDNIFNFIDSNLKKYEERVKTFQPPYHYVSYNDVLKWNEGVLYAYNEIKNKLSKMEETRL